MDKKSHKLTCAHKDCKKKIKLAEQIMGKCRCNNIYCVLHRMPERHDCSFNFAIDKEIFIQENKCVEPKLKFTICSSER